MSFDLQNLYNLLKLSTAKRKLEALEENNTVALYNQVKMNRNTINNENSKLSSKKLISYKITV